MEPFADNTRALDRFLASVERRALKMAQFATGSTEEEQERIRRVSRWYRNLPP